MTDETSRPTSEDTPAPPASTRWTEDPLREDDALASPFVPGRSTPAAESEPAPATAPPFSRAAPAREAPPVEEAPLVEDEPDDFPFDKFDLEGEGQGRADAAPEAGIEADEQTSGATPEVAEPDATGMGWTPADLDLDEVEEATAGGEQSGEQQGIEEPAAEESVAAEPAVDMTAIQEPDDEAATGAGPAGEAAEVLERMAGLLRNDGLDAVRREMESSDRLTSLLAGLVAGYVSGRSGR